MKNAMALRSTKGVGGERAVGGGGGSVIKEVLILSI